MQPLPAGQRQSLGQCLPHKFMPKAIPRIAARRFGGYQVRSFRFLNGVKRRIGLLVLEFFKQPQTEASSNHGGRGEYAPGVGSQPIQPSTQNQANALGNLQLIHTQARTPLSALVEQFAFLGKMAEHFLHEERIAFRLFEHHTSQRRWRLLTAHRRQHALDPAHRQPPQ